MTDHLEELLEQMEQEEEEQAALWDRVHKGFVGAATGGAGAAAKVKSAPGQAGAAQTAEGAPRQAGAAQTAEGALRQAGAAQTAEGAPGTTEYVADAAKRMVSAVEREIAAEVEAAEHSRLEKGHALTEQLEKLRRAVRQMVQPGGRRTASPSAGNMGTAASGWTNGGLTTFAAAHYAAMVDAAFQRDARRYDGPLGLL